MKKLILAATFSFLTFSVSAQEVDQERLEAADTLLDTMGVREDMSTNFQSSMTTMLQPMVQQLGLDAEQTKELNAIVTDWWENDIDQDAIMTEFQKLYAESFTTGELEELNLFYQTPLGQKVVELMPELTQKGMQIGMQAAQSKQALLMEKMQAFEAGIQEEQAEDATEDTTEDEGAE
jgi:hypothetical protein